MADEPVPAETTVRALLDAAQLPASEAEVAALTAAYPGLMAGIADLYTPAEVRYLDPALRFRAEVTGPDWAH